MESIKNYEIKNQNEDRISSKIEQITKSNPNNRVSVFTQDVPLNIKSKYFA